MSGVTWSFKSNTLTDIINQLPVGTYTFSYTITLTERNNVADESIYGIKMIRQSSPNPTFDLVYMWGDSSIGTSKQVTSTFTITESNQGNIGNVYFYGCGLVVSGATGKADFTIIMLNSGTALPYEPYNVVDWYTNHGHGYSSGAWD